MIRSLHAGRALVALIVLAAIYIAIEYLPLGMLPHPVAVDDYTNVGSSIADMGTRWKRPVSANLIFLFAHYAPASSYVFMAALAIANAALVLWLLSRVFAARLPMAAVCAFGIVTFSHVSAFSHTIFLGLLTNLISHVFGLLCLLALWCGWNRRRHGWLALALAAQVLSAFAKEDFLLPPVFLAVLLALRTPPGPSGGRRGGWWMAAALLAIGAGSMAWQAIDRNPFVAGLFSPDTSPAPYVLDLSPGGLARSFWTLLVQFAPWACGAAAVAWAAMFAKLPQRRMELVWYAAVLLALVLPYAVIPRTIVPARTYAWLPWLVALAVVGWSLWHARLAPRHRVVSAAGVVLVALGVAALQWPARAAPLEDYMRQAAKNRTMVETLLAHRAELVRHPEVGLVGLGEWGPWCAQDALYVHGKLGFEAQRWIVFVAAPTRCYTQQERDVARKRGVNIGVAESALLCAHGAMPVLEFALDGSGRLRRADDYCEAPVPNS